MSKLIKKYKKLLKKCRQKAKNWDSLTEKEQHLINCINYAEHLRKSRIFDNSKGHTN